MDTFWTLTRVLSGVTPLSIGALVVGTVVAYLISRFINFITGFYLSSAITKLEDFPLKIVVNIYQ